jgi:hypothetical protein
VPDGGNSIASPNGLQSLGGLRTRIHRSADLAQRASRFENLGLDPEEFERVRGGEPGQSTADDRYPTA